MALIKLIDGRDVQVDDDIYTRFSKYRWRLCPRSNIVKSSNYIEGRRETSLASWVMASKNDFTSRPVNYLDGDVLNLKRENVVMHNIRTIEDLEDGMSVTIFSGAQFLVSGISKEFLLNFKWHINAMGYVVFKSEGKTITLHRFLLKESLTPELVVDHKNHDTTDNRLSNLRICDRKLNGANRLKDTHGIRRRNSLHKGISKNQSGTWLVRVGSTKYGTFPTEAIAAAVYNYYAKQMYGEFAYLNDVPEIDIDDIRKYRILSNREKGAMLNESGKGRFDSDDSLGAWVV